MRVCFSEKARDIPSVLRKDASPLLRHHISPTTLANRHWAMSVYEYGSPLDVDVPEGSRYLGCYRDHRFERALSQKLAVSGDMTHEVRRKASFSTLEAQEPRRSLISRLVRGYEDSRRPKAASLRIGPRRGRCCEGRCS